VSALTKTQIAFLNRLRERGPFTPYGSEWNTAYRLTVKGLVSLDRGHGWIAVLTEAGSAALEAES
jgi:hypothetical protein